MNRAEDNAHIESDDVAAVSVLRTGDSDRRAKKTRIEDFTAFAAIE